MLQITVEDRFKLDLPSNLEIQITEENPLFMEDYIPTPYSLSFDIPPTNWNLQRLGYPTRINSKIIKYSVRARVFSNDINYSSGEIIVLGFEQNIRLQYKGSVEDISITTPLNELNLSGVTAGFVGEHSLHYYTLDHNQYPAPNVTYVEYMKNRAVNQDIFAIGPVRITDKEWDGVGYTLGGMNAEKTYLNYYTPGTAGFLFKGTSGDQIHTPVMPFIYIKDVFRAVFGNDGYNPFSEGDMAKLCLISENHPKYDINSLVEKDQSGNIWLKPLMANEPVYYNNQNVGSVFDVILNFAQYQQNCKFNEVMKEIFKIFGISAYPGMTYEFITDDETLSRDAKIKLDNYLVGDLTCEYAENETEYVFGYNNSGEDCDDVVTKVDNLAAAIADINLPQREFLTEYDYQDLSTGKIVTLKKTLRGLANDTWLDCKTKRSELVQTTNSEIETKYNVTSSVSPLEMNIEQYWWQNDGGNDLIVRRHWHVPTIERGSITDMPHIMLSYGMSQTVENYAGVDYPLITNHNYDMFGNKRGDISLLPNGPDGVISKFQSYKKNWINKKKATYKGSFCLDEKTNRTLKIYDKCYLKGKLVLMKSREYSLTHQGISLVDLELVEDL